MNKVIIVTILLLVYFGLGLSSGFVLSGRLVATQELPSATDINIPLDVPSPSDHVKEDQITVSQGKIDIAIPGREISWARFAPTNSMDPVLDETANSIEIVPTTTSDIHVGDIIAFTYNNDLIVHRVLDIGYDEQGWYAQTKGDNINMPDPGQRRFADIKFVTVGIIY